MTEEKEKPKPEPEAELLRKLLVRKTKKEKAPPS